MVFDLIPISDVARDIVRDPFNSGRMRQDPGDPSIRFLRIGMHPSSKTPGFLVKIGRNSSNDIILRRGWSRIDQCYFDIHPDSGELLLHDVSSRGNTRLRDENGADQIRKSPRQCVVLLNREWKFQIGNAVFALKPRTTQDPKAFTKERLSFTHQPVPEEYEGTYEGTFDQMSALDLRSSRSSVYNTRMKTPFQPEPGQEIRYTKVRQLGKGSQGSVHEVVDMYTGQHYACKVIRPKLVPKLGIATEKDFKVKIEAEVALLSKLHHVSFFVLTPSYSCADDL